MDESQPYDLLSGLTEENIPKALHLFALAGELWSGGGFFFEKRSQDYLNAMAVVSVYDMGDDLVGTLPHPNFIVNSVLLGQDSRFSTISLYKIQIQTTEDQLLALQRIRQVLLKNIQGRGADAGEEYRLFSSLLGGKAFTAEELQTAVQKAMAG